MKYDIIETSKHLFKDLYFICSGLLCCFYCFHLLSIHSNLHPDSMIL